MFLLTLLVQEKYFNLIGDLSSGDDRQSVP